MTAILALYDADEKLIAMDMITNDEFNTSAQKLSAKTDKTPARAKIFIWLSMDDCLPYGEMLIDEKI